MTPPTRAIVGGLGGTLLAVALMTGLLLRLARVPRPRFEPVETIARGRIAVGRVRLERRGDGGRGVVLGWSVVCGGREVFSRVGDAPFRIDARDDDVATITEPHAGRTVRVRAPDCAVLPAGP